MAVYLKMQWSSCHLAHSPCSALIDDAARRATLPVGDSVFLCNLSIFFAPQLPPSSCSFSPGSGVSLPHWYSILVLAGFLFTPPWLGPIGCQTPPFDSSGWVSAWTTLPPLRTQPVHCPSTLWSWSRTDFEALLSQWLAVFHLLMG